MGLRQRRWQSGVTLPEVIVVVLLLVVVGMLTNVSLRILHGLKREGNRMEASRDAHVFMYQLSKEVRNAKSILYISSETMTLTAYDFSLGFDVGTAASPNPRLFNPLRISTITYTCVFSSGAYAIERYERSPDATFAKQFFRGTLVMPGDPEPSKYYEVFSRRFGQSSCPCDYVHINIRLTPGFHRQQPLNYSIEAAVRSYSG